MALLHTTALLCGACALLSCAAELSPEELPSGELLAYESGKTPLSAPPLSAPRERQRSLEELYAQLDALAEAERRNGFAPGMGLSESALREEAADYAGALIAAYKELAYAYGAGLLDGEQIRQGLDAVMERFDPRDGEKGQTILDAALALRAFLDGNFTLAGEFFAPLSAEEPDSFAQWLYLVCRLEDGLLKEQGNRAELVRYRALRLRYEYFTEYWYRLARFTKEAAAAERCIDLAPQGPYALLCRNALAGHFGLPVSNSPALRTRGEIEQGVSASLAAGDPGALESFFPLLALEDNPLTLYALGAFQALAAAADFNAYFSAGEKLSSGRLKERLRFIVRSGS
jgi:hypothetical protein